jgi:hypothetical protein
LCGGGVVGQPTTWSIQLEVGLSWAVTIGIPNANHNLVNKKDVSLALRNHDRVEILEKFGKYKKLDKILSDDPTKPKDY